MGSMKDIWFISDTHFTHENILKFTGEDGKLIRPGFSSVEEMDETMIDNWNKHVKDGDKVYHLGDVIMHQGTREIQTILSRLNGSKRLIVGNHDDRSLRTMMPFFKKVGLWRIFKDEGFVCSHIPLMEGQFRNKVTMNVHGHIHERRMAERDKYINICVEHTGYRPLHMDEILEMVRNGSQ